MKCKEKLCGDQSTAGRNGGKTTLTYKSKMPSPNRMQCEQCPSWFCKIPTVFNDISALYCQKNSAESSCP